MRRESPGVDAYSADSGTERPGKPGSRKSGPPGKGGYPGQKEGPAPRKGAGPPRGGKGGKTGGAKGRKGKAPDPARRKARLARRKKIMDRSKPLKLASDDDDPNEYVLSRFIINPWGQQLGESIGVEGKSLIMKKGLKFYSIPISYLRESGADLVLAKKVDWAKALALGEKWRKTTLELPSPKPLFEKSKEM